MQSPDSRLVNDLNELKEVAGMLGEVLVKGRTNAALIAILMEYPCLARCYDEMVHPSYHPIDSFYQERHEFLRRILIDALHVSLGDRFHEMGVGGEHQTDLGRGDIDLTWSRTGLEVSNGSSRVRIEIKGGSNFSIAQVMRHLIDVDVVLVCLAGRGDAFAVRYQEAEAKSVRNALAEMQAEGVFPTRIEIERRTGIGRGRGLVGNLVNEAQDCRLRANGINLDEITTLLWSPGRLTPNWRWQLARLSKQEALARLNRGLAN